MTILEDEGQKNLKHIQKNKYWEENGIRVVRLPIPVGDYVLANDKVRDVVNRKSARGVKVKKMDLLGTYSVAVDTKRNMAEICGNICGTKKDHDRFRDELILAQNNGIKLYILVEHEPEYLDRKQTIWNGPINSIKDVFQWKNPRLFVMNGSKQKYPRATKGTVLAKAMATIEKKYDCEFVFCRPKDAGKKVIELLGGDQN